MRITSNKTNHKFIFVVIAFILAVVLVCGIYYLYDQQHKESNNSKKSPEETRIKPQATDKEKDQERQYNATQKQKFNDNEAAASEGETSSGSTPTTNNISLSTQSDGSVVTILTKLDSVSSGTCSLTITNKGKTYTDTANVIYQPEYSSCAGFTVKKDLLGNGTWLIKISIKTPSSTIEKTITYGV